MSDKFQNHYRISSARWATWDYGSNAPYFVTICTKHRISYFGSITHGKIHYTELGKQAARHWSAIPNHFPFVILDAFIIMPNHIHGIIVIDKPAHSQRKWEPNRFGPQSQNLASIIRGFKIGVTKASRQKIPLFE